MLKKLNILPEDMNIGIKSSQATKILGYNDKNKCITYDIIKTYQDMNWSYFNVSKNPNICVDIIKDNILHDSLPENYRKEFIKNGNEPIVEKIYNRN